VSKTKCVVECLRRVHREIVKLQPGPTDPLTRILRDVENTLANPAIVDVIERRAKRRRSAMDELHEQERRYFEGRSQVPANIAPGVSLLMLGAIDAEPSPESIAEMPEIRDDQVPLGRGLLRARRAAALRFSAGQLRATGEAGTASSAILLTQLAESYED